MFVTCHACSSSNTEAYTALVSDDSQTWRWSTGAQDYGTPYVEWATGHPSTTSGKSAGVITANRDGVTSSSDVTSYKSFFCEIVVPDGKFCVFFVPASMCDNKTREHAVALALFDLQCSKEC